MTGAPGEIRTPYANYAGADFESGIIVECEDLQDRLITRIEKNACQFDLITCPDGWSQLDAIGSSFLNRNLAHSSTLRPQDANRLAVVALLDEFSPCIGELQ